MFNFFKISKVYAATNNEEIDGIVGSINVPKGVDLINKQTGIEGGIGIILFISNMIKLFTMIGGVWIIINISLAAFTYITGGGKADSSTKVNSYVSMSVIGLLLMISAYAVAGIIGLVFYDNAGFILKPTIDAIGGTTTL